ncbi:MAG: DNA polymerase I [Sphaerochaetaceae bacterium]|nr:DNA polymerase I [Sphaerochaetaceae bacterium]
MERKKLFVVDGYGQIFRAYYAFVTNPFRDKNGVNISAVYGFFNTIMSLIRQYKPDYFAVALDSKGKTFRHDMFPEYKANRDKTPEDLHAQIPVIKDVMDKIGMKHFEEVGMEADDIIATLSRITEAMDVDVVIVTADKDLLQLVDGHVSALRPPKKGQTDYMLCKDAEVQEIFGVRPDQIVDYLTILGDTADNVPGIKGLGEKSAVSLLQKYDSLENVYEHLSEQTASVQKKLNEAKDHLKLSHDLIVLKDDLFDSSFFKMEDLETARINWQDAGKLFSTIGSPRLSRTAERMGGPKSTGRFTPSVTENRDSLFFEENDEQNTDVELYKADNLIGCDLKEKIREFKSQGIKANPVFDITLAAWLLNSDWGNYDKQRLMALYEVSNEAELYAKVSSALKKRGLDKVLQEFEMPLIPILAEMEDEGIILDPERLRSFEKELTEATLKIEQDIYTLCGHVFNINSPKQLQEVLFVERDLPTVKKTSRGFSTDSEVLEALASSTEDPVPALILEYRAKNKLLSTYVSALTPMINPQTGRLHTTFLQTGTATGRLSSKNPNLQNIPIRTDDGRRIRDAFVPKKGCLFLSADYSQIELAVMAHMSGDENMKSSFKEHRDVHAQTASLIFDVMPDLVTPSQRRVAKVINFGVIYGMSSFRLSQDLHITPREAKAFIDTYFERYKGITAFIESTKENARKTLMVSTLGGHVRSIPDMTSSNHVVRSAAERVAVNTVIQGTASEIVKKAMIGISKALKEGSYKAKMLLQVHDEVILEVPEDEIESVKTLVRTEMEKASPLSIPLGVSIETGHSWGEMH